MSYLPIKTYPILKPLAWIYRLGVAGRNLLFDWGVKRSRTFPLPVICVGNLTVGGTGKTPHTEYLIRLLSERLQVAVLSRGYKRKSKGFVLADAETTVAEIGDEPFQMAHKFPEIYVAVDHDRCHGIERLIDGRTAPGTAVVLLDDAFQHRYVKAGLNILLIDYHRPVFQDKLLPEGRLREPVSGKKRAQIIIVSKCPSCMTEAEREVWRKDLKLDLSQQLYFTTFTYGLLQPLFITCPERSLNELRSEDQVLLVTGIASPKSVVETLECYCRVIPVTFPDHHNFSAPDLQRIEQAYRCLPSGSTIVTTEKDAVRLMVLSSLIADDVKKHLFVLPVAVSFLGNEQETFNKNIIEYVRENTRNSSFSES